MKCEICELLPHRKCVQHEERKGLTDKALARALLKLELSGKFNIENPSHKKLLMKNEENNDSIMNFLQREIDEINREIRIL